MSKAGAANMRGGVLSAARWAAGLAAAVLLSACASSDGSIVSKISDGFTGRNKPDDIPQEYFLKKGYCPPVQLRIGTGILVVYERGHDADPDFVRHQASITKTARECATTAEGLAIKIGIAGRAVAGPKGVAGDLTLPIRVVVAKQSGGVIFSELFKIPVTLSPPDLGTDFARVVDQIAVPVGPDERDLTVYVGFDEGMTG